MQEKLTQVSNTKDHDLVEYMREVREILNDLGIEFWLDGATLLGAVRDGEIVPWDHDIDFTIWKESIAGDKGKTLIRRLREEGFKVGIYDININVRKFHVLDTRKSDRERVWLDINLFDYDDTYAILPHFYPCNITGRIMSYSTPILVAPQHCYVRAEEPFFKRSIRRILITVARATPIFLRKLYVRIGTIILEKIGSRNEPHRIPIHYFTNLKTIRFYDMDFKVPAETEEYLAFRYGKNWRTPIQDWVTERDDGAIVPSKNA